MKQKMLSTLNSEIKPEHAGSRAAMKTLFAEFLRRGLDKPFHPSPSAAANIEHETKRMKSSDAANNKEQQQRQQEQEERQLQPFPDFDSWCFCDDYYMELHVQRAAYFFAWLGVIQPQAPTAAAPWWRGKMPLWSDMPCLPRKAATDVKKKNRLRNDDDDYDAANGGAMGSREISASLFAVMSASKSGSFDSETAVPLKGKQDGAAAECIVCMEKAEHFIPFDHASPIGDVSSHRACTSCFSKMRDLSACPLCRGELACQNLIESLSVSFADAIASTAAQKGDPHKSAELVEAWQFLEMEHSQQAVLERVALQLLKSPRVGGAIAAVVRTEEKNKVAWLRDIAGFIFRLHALSRDRMKLGPLAAALNPDIDAMLSRAVDLILQPFEHNASTEGIDAHNFGALYSQALAALLSARGGGLPTNTLVALVQRTARALATAFSRSDTARRSDLSRRAKETVISHYIDAVKIMVWGEHGEDLFVKTFGKQ